jgi:hypothetical protein
LGRNHEKILLEKILTMHEFNISHIVNHGHFSLANFFMVKKTL